MKALIVDDERLARGELRRMLERHSDIEVAGEARDIEEAAAMIRELEPALIFLDIQMPGGSGFDLLERLDNVPDVIFTTAYDEYALRAFEVNAVDYLLKPIQPARLDAALERLRAREASAAATLPANSRIFVRDGERCWFVRLSDITLFEGEGNYTRLLFGTSRPLVLRSLAYLEERLDPAVFFRASRKHIINLQHVESLDPWVTGGFRVRMRNGAEIEMSRRQALRFRDLMSL
jgi:two-component system LytT family response regulator